MNDHINTILPIAWQWLELEQLIVSHDGKRVPVRKADRDQMQGDIPYYGASGIIDYVDSYLFDGNYLLLAEDGANLLSRSKPIAFQAHGQFWVNNHAHIFQTKGEIPLAYLEHYLNSFHLARFVTGTAQPKLTKRNMNRIPVPVAPLEEQKRIVAEIETQFARLDQVVASLERLRVKLKQYRASVLKAACEGRLVPQDPNDEPADVLLARILKERRRKWEAQAWQKEIAKAQKKAAKATRKANGNPFKRGDKLTDVEWRDLPEAVYKRYLPKNEKWKEKYQEPKGVGDTSKSDLPLQWAFLQINSVAFVTKLAGFEYTKFVNYTPSGDLPVIKAENITNKGFKLTEFSRIHSESVEHLVRSHLQPLDLLMVFIGAKLGNVALLPSDRDYFLGPNVALIRLESSYLQPDFTEIWLRSPAGFRYIKGLSKATAQGSISMGSIRQIPVPIPPLAEQQRIVKDLKHKLLIVENTEHTINANLKHAARLRQAILKKAFSGQLVPQNPNDEPATTLLNQIATPVRAGLKPAPTP